MSPQDGERQPRHTGPEANKDLAKLEGDTGKNASIMPACACSGACFCVVVRLCAHVLQARGWTCGRRRVQVAVLCKWPCEQLCAHVRARAEKRAGSRVH